MNLKSTLTGFLVLFFYSSLYAQEIKFYPTNWFTGMKWNKVQILVHGSGDNFNEAKVSLSYPGVLLQKTEKLPNKNYYALDVLISPNAKPGNVVINFSKGKNNIKTNWPIVTRRTGNGKSFAQGVTAKDLIYLIMPDRFSNGDKTNDRVAGMLDQSLNRDTVFKRHGGDLQGIINHLDYLKELGVTALWLTPVWENDMPNRTEHGYAATDNYKVDPRLGGNEKYIQLSKELHKRGMKLVQDVVYNHVGMEHIFVKDKPTSTWLHNWDKFTQTTYKDQPLFDPHAAEADKKIMQDGWFTKEMPDLNQSDPHVANYLIQQSLWTAETFGVDGWRIDTYAYNDLNFMNRCNKALYDEFPSMTIFGETYVHGVINQSYFCDNNYNIPFKSNLQGTTDFQTLFYGIQPALTEKFGWTEGVNKLYTTTAQDFVYKDPMREVIFLDNHDLARFYSVLNEDTAKYKMAMAWLMTFRGIPQMYYGSEILMTGFTNPDGNVRRDFPGGWEGDPQNKFTDVGRTPKENDVYTFIKTLANFRKNSSAITAGKLMQYVPVDGLYVYFRYDKNQTIACIMNTGESEKNVDLLSYYKERTTGFKNARNVANRNEETMNVNIKPMQMKVLELVK